MSMPFPISETRKLDAAQSTFVALSARLTEHSKRVHFTAQPSDPLNPDERRLYNQSVVVLNLALDPTLQHLAQK